MLIDSGKSKMLSAPFPSWLSSRTLNNSSKILIMSMLKVVLEMPKSVPKRRSYRKKHKLTRKYSVLS